MIAPSARMPSSLTGSRNRSSSMNSTFTTRSVRNDDQAASNPRPRRAVAGPITESTTTSTATATVICTGVASTPGRICAKIVHTIATSAIFSSTIALNTRRRACRSSRRASPRSSFPGRSGATSSIGWSPGLSLGQTQKAKNAAKVIRKSATATANAGWSRTASVKSSWATWIHHSCGSLTKTQMLPAASSQNRRLIVTVRQRNATTWKKMKKYSNVFGKASSSHRCWAPPSSNSRTPTMR